MYLHPTAGWLASWRSCSAGKIWPLVAGRSLLAAGHWLLETGIQPIHSFPILLFLRFQCSGVRCQGNGDTSDFDRYHLFSDT
jgi:hypothetical protein